MIAEAVSADPNSLSFAYILRRLTVARLSMAHEERRPKPNATLIEGLRREYYWWEARIDKEHDNDE